ncbi:iron complex outermembrane recepter protein [Aliiroseovarius halocynthiae]|uniref:TonB-dependent siderophore receptor n=1 Tax=Aliiroseovarius halocynthiae TaxID=985055 RepID=A0A545SLD6_9RHOB|nr:TonB-dependent siderophore receptor [Aliiroseovarius halocynthiae]TQV65771.1 TonB-dependent siderophore receptor [Aliiroseovarius halocynthiae]SMR83537.1 iron complex outermembrane recepter protein [Aliiroseovarius halocynthiae]
MTRFHFKSVSAMLMMSTILAPAVGAAQDADTGAEDFYLGTIVLQAINDGGAGVSSVEAANTAGTRVPVDPSDLPRSVTILPRELFEAQGARTMEETVAYSPGITTGTYGHDDRYDEFILRGFEAQIGGVFRDAMPLRTVDWASWRTEPFGLESVNILRGPTSDLYGANQPGGLINAVTKRPEFTFGGEVQTIISDHGGKQVGLDVTGPLSDTLAYRLVGVWNESGTHFDEVDTGRIYIAPSLTFAPSDQTTLTVYGQYQEDNVGNTYITVPKFGTLEPNNVATFGPDTYVGNPEYNTIESTQKYLGYEFEHAFDNGLTFVSRARVSDNTWDDHTEFAGAFVNSSYLLGAPVGLPSDIDMAIMTKFDVDQSMQQHSFDNAVHVDIDTGNVVGQVAVGIDHYRVHSATDFTYAYAGELNLLTGDRTPYLTGTGLDFFLPNHRTTDLKQTGIYATGHAEVNDTFILSGGVRHDWIDQSVTGYLTNPLTGTSDSIDNKINETFTSGNLALGYRIAPELMAYGSFSRSFSLPPSGENVNGGGLAIETAKSFEVGMKYQSADGHSSIGLSAYSITKNDVAFSVAPQLFTQVGEVRSRGIELEATHDFGNGLSLFGSAGYVDASIVENHNNLYVGNQVPRAPKFSAALFAQYEVPSIEGLTFSAGARHTGARYAFIGNQDELPASTLFDASVSYEYNDWNMQLAVRNLANKQDIGFCSPAVAGAFLPAGLGTTSGTCVYNSGREISLSLSRTF